MTIQSSIFLKKVFENISYHKIETRFSPANDIILNYWPGSVIRNNLLYAAEQHIVKKGISLLQLINELPITEDHPFFQELSGGFPKGYSLTGVWNSDSGSGTITLRKNELYKFSICLIGKMSELCSGFIEAIKMMCARGIGPSMTPLNLIDICEVHPVHPARLIYINGIDTINPLCLPIVPEDFSNPGFSDKTEINLRFITPVSLTQYKEKKNRDISFQDKQNGFPSFYQLTRSVLYRLIKLSALYCGTEYEIFNSENMKYLDEWLQDAGNPVLVSVNIRRVSVVSTPRKENENQIKFRGYIGDMRYYGMFERYMLLLLFAQDLGAGNDVVYGMGEYRVRSRMK